MVFHVNPAAVYVQKKPFVKVNKGVIACDCQVFSNREVILGFFGDMGNSIGKAVSLDWGQAVKHFDSTQKYFLGGK